MGVPLALRGHCLEADAGDDLLPGYEAKVSGEGGQRSLQESEPWMSKCAKKEWQKDPFETLRRAIS